MRKTGFGKRDGAGRVLAAAALALSLVLTGCSLDAASNSPEDVRVTLLGVTADGAQGTAGTTALTLTFDQKVAGLAAADISWSEGGAARGALSGEGPVYTLEVSAVSANTTISVTVEKAGCAISGSPKAVTIYAVPGVTVSGPGVVAPGWPARFSAAVVNAADGDVSWSVVTGAAITTTAGAMSAGGVLTVAADEADKTELTLTATVGSVSGSKTVQVRFLTAAAGEAVTKVEAATCAADLKTALEGVPGVTVPESFAAAAAGDFDAAAAKVRELLEAIAGANGAALTRAVKALNEYLANPAQTVVNIAYLRATFPVLNFAMEVFDISQDPTYVNLERYSTFSYERLPDNVKIIPGTSTVSGANYWGSEVTRTAQFVADLYAFDPAMMFNLYVCDFDIANALYFMEANGVPRENYNVICYMDGSGSYNAPKARYAGTDAAEKLESDCALMTGVFDKARAGEDWQSVVPDKGSRAGEELLSYTLAIVKTFPFVTWAVDSTSALVEALPNLAGDVEGLIAQGRIVQRNLTSMVDNVKAKGKTKELEYLLKLRWGEADADCIASLFDKGNAKKTLMILGTRDDLETAGDTNDQLGYKLIGAGGFMEHVLERYGGGYNVFYKGHPATPTANYPDKQAWFDAHGITDILATIPAETMMYLYDGVFIGGYPGSTFNSSLDGQCVVSFGTPAYFTATAPAAEAAYFANTEFMYKDAATGELVIGNLPAGE